MHADVFLLLPFLDRLVRNIDQISICPMATKLINLLYYNQIMSGRGCQPRTTLMRISTVSTLPFYLRTNHPELDLVVFATFSLSNILGLQDD